MKTYSGFTNKTPEHLLLDAGAFFKNFDVEKDTFDSAVTAGKLIGATSGGGEFNAKPEIRQIPIDGVKGKAKGLEALDSWDVVIKANVIEVSKETIVSALCAADIDTTSNAEYDIIKGRNNIELSDYIDNITWVGTLSGSNKPVIIVVYNALNTEGLVLQTQDKNQAVVATSFSGHYEMSNLQSPPFDIYYPKAESKSPTPNSSDTEDES